MPRPTQRTLVLMRDSSAIHPPLFVADLYSGNRLEDSVYLERDAMLEWVKPLGPAADSSAALAMYRLLCQPGLPLIDIPLGPVGVA